MVTFAESSSDEDNSTDSNNKIEGSAEHQNFVQLVFNEPRSLGLEIFRHRNGVVKVTSVGEDGQAESICVDTLLEPEALNDATIIAINGVPFDTSNKGIPLYFELKSRARPKNILFALRTTNIPDIKNTFCVNTIRNGKFVEFVFWKAIMGVRVNQKKDEHLLKVDRIDKKSEAADIIQQTLLDPNVFKGASIVGVNGRKYKKKSAMFTALTTPNRPKFVLFKLSQSLESSLLYDTTAAAKPQTIFETPQKGIEQKVPLTQENINANNDDDISLSSSKKSSSLDDTTAAAKPPTKLPTFDKHDKGIERKASLTIEDINGNGNDDTPLSSSERSFARTSPGLSKTPRRASATMLEKAVYASKSMRQLSVAYEDDDDDVDSSSTTSSTRSPSSRRQIHQLDQAELVSESKRKLDTCMGEMEKFNSKIDEEAENQRKYEESMARMEQLNMENERSISNQRDIRNGNNSNPNMDNSMGSGIEKWSNARDKIISPRATKARAILQGFQKFKVGERVRQRWNSSSLHSFDDIGTTSFGRSADQDEDDAAEHERLKKEAYEACIKAIRDHLEAFLAETPDVSYEEWIEELHPENAKSRRNLVKGRAIDHRFYVENSDHRKLWNENLEEDSANDGGGVAKRQYVPIRDYVPVNDGYNDNSVAPLAEKTKKSLSFKRKCDVPDRRTSSVKFSDIQKQELQ